MNHVYIVFDSGEGVLIYEAWLTDDEQKLVESCQNVYGGSTGATEEQDSFLCDFPEQLSNARKVFDSTAEPDDDLSATLTMTVGAKLYVMGFVP